MQEVHVIIIKYLKVLKIKWLMKIKLYLNLKNTILNSFKVIKIIEII